MAAKKAAIKKLFESFDSNKNGVLEKQEFILGFKEMIYSLGDSLSPKELEAIAEEAIANFDLNGNGVIEMNEFTELIDFLVNEKGLKLDYD